MKQMINLLGLLYKKNKLLFMAILILLMLFIAGCFSNGSAPSGPIGGGCSS